MTLHRPVFIRINLAWLFLAAIILSPLPAIADGDGVPAEVLDLLPPSEKITNQEGSHQKDEDWNIFSWDMEAKWPRKYPDCYGSMHQSNISIEIDGDLEWATEDHVKAMSEQLSDIYNDKLDNSRAEMAEDLLSSIYPQSKGKFWEETLPNGSIFVTEFTEECDGRANPVFTMVDGYALRHPFTLEVRLSLNDSSAVAREMVVGILDKFEKLDLEALTK